MEEAEHLQQQQQQQQHIRSAPVTVFFGESGNDILKLKSSGQVIRVLAHAFRCLTSIKRISTGDGVESCLSTDLFNNDDIHNDHSVPPLAVCRWGDRYVSP
jgi:hypothetical protein